MSEMLLHGSGTIPGHNASVAHSLDRESTKEADHMLATCALVLVVSFSPDRNRGRS